MINSAESLTGKSNHYSSLAEPNNIQLNETIEQTQKKAVEVISNAWIAQKEGRFVMTVGKQLCLAPPYKPERRSLKLGLKDDQGRIAIYRKRYEEIPEPRKQWLETQGPTLGRKIEWLNSEGLSPIYYFSEKTLQEICVPQTGKLINLDELPGLEQGGRVNCVVIKEGKIYIYSKKRNHGHHASDIGIAHTSASLGKPVDFSGTLRKTGDVWILCNLSGHYKTPASKMSICLKAFQDKKISLENLDVMHWIRVDSDHPELPPDSQFLLLKHPDGTFLISVVSALAWIERTSLLQCKRKDFRCVIS